MALEKLGTGLWAAQSSGATVSDKYPYKACIESNAAQM